MLHFDASQCLLPCPPVVLYKVERFVARRGSGPSLKFLVKWGGYTEAENTWEPAAQLKEDMKGGAYNKLLKALDRN